MNALSSDHKIMARGTFWSLLGSAGVKLASFALTIILARFFAVEDIGVFNLGLALVGMITIFSDLGLAAALPRYIPYFKSRGEEEKAAQVLDAAYLVTVLFSIIIAGLVFAGAPFIEQAYATPGLAIVLQILAVYVVLNNSINVHTAYLTGIGKIKETSVVFNIQAILRFITTIILFLVSGPGLWVIPTAYVLSFLPGTVLGWWYTKTPLPVKTKTQKEYWKILNEIVPYGLTLTLVGALWVQTTSLDKAMLGLMLPENIKEAYIGIYSIATSLAGIIMVFAGALTPIFLPTVTSALAKNNKKQALVLSQMGVQWIIMLMAPFTIVLIVFADVVLELFYGKVYAIGAGVLMLAALGVFVRALSLVQGALLAAMRKVQIELLAGVAAFITNAGLNMALIPIYGMEGAALASLVAFGVVTVILTYYSNKHAGFWFSKELYKPIVAGALVLVVCLLIKPHMVPLINGISVPVPVQDPFGVIQKASKLFTLGILFAIVAFVYGLVLILLQAFHKEEIALVAGALRRVRTPSPFIAMVERFMGKRED